MERGIWRRTAFGAVVIMGIITALFATAQPASAYGTVDITWIEIDTTYGHNCARIDGGGLTVDAQPAGCFLGDSVDDTFFVWDANGAAMKAELRVSGNLIAKFEFHPYGEVLWLYDTRDPDDTVYIRVRLAGLNWPENPRDITTKGIWPASGQRTRDLDFAEQRLLVFDFCDDSTCADILRDRDGIPIVAYGIT